MLLYFFLKLAYDVYVTLRGIASFAIFEGGW